MKYRHWEKRLDNGSIGEARTKELIIDRFWVLERSIDREGADFLIQRKLTQISSIEPPRFGIIQSKFRENINSIINIKEDYVNDTFFLFIHTGFEDDKKVYFLTGKDISEFRCENENYKVKISEKEHRVSSIEDTLDIIEDNIMRSEISNNQMFVKEYFTGDCSQVDEIEEEFELELFDSYKTMEDVKDIKKYAFDMVEELLENIAPLKQIIIEKNPVNLLELYDDSYDRLVLDIDFERMKDLLTDYNKKFQRFYYDTKEEIKSYKEYIDKLGTDKVDILIEIKKLIFIKLKEEFNKQEINSIEQIFYIGFFIKLQVSNGISIKNIEIEAGSYSEQDELTNGNYIYALEGNKINNQISFYINWRAREDYDGFYQDSYIYNLSNALMDIAKFLEKNY